MNNLRDHNNRDEYEVDFDQYQRYKLVQDIISFYRTEPGTTFRVLEVGSNEPKHLRLFLPHDSILFTDIELTVKMQQDPEFQVADGTNLPFADESFDFVVATDVLEHIPQEKRSMFCQEMLRVARKCAILTFPYRSDAVTAAENRIRVHMAQTACGIWTTRDRGCQGDPGRHRLPLYLWISWEFAT